VDVRPFPQPVVRAAGGVVWRPSRGVGRVFAVVHRPAYDDWTLPKGKLDGDETEEEAALREVEEETGMRCRLGRPLGTTSYVDRKGRPKIVYYWMMRAISGQFTPHAEIDECRWLPLDEALTLLSYDRDRTLLGSLGTEAQAEDIAAAL
jgi:8-oxo-dGTP pyrophosphatase MutT (NUDIX family)